VSKPLLFVVSWGRPGHGAKALFYRCASALELFDKLWRSKHKRWFRSVAVRDRALFSRRWRSEVVLLDINPDVGQPWRLPWDDAEALESHVATWWADARLHFPEPSGVAP
jgi:hypothetical protein